ncbi:MAG: L-serine ammonia-lyase, iron-sulfur-dependent, subunit alpha [Syntrophobacterales bacterium]|jgi:L-cysteine desulfidase
MGITLKDILHNRASTLLHLETEAGLGCTEPAAIGLAAAAAAALLESHELDTIEVEVDPNIFRNALAVTIPASGGQCGLELAAAMGAAVGDPTLKLQVFAGMDSPRLEMAKRLVQEGKVSVTLHEGPPGIYIKATVSGAGHTIAAVISGQHGHLEALFRDGQPLPKHPWLSRREGPEMDLESLEKWLISLSLAEMVELLNDLDRNDLAYLQKGVDLNLKLAETGFAQSPGLAVGQTQASLVQQGLLKKDMVLWGGMLTAAGIDARMGGVMQPAMTLAGSGNQCIAASLPLVAAADFATLEDRQILLKGVMLSYLVTCYLKTLVGRLSALCGSGVASGAGVAAGVTYILGGSVDQIGGAIKNHLENFATVICDGAKTGCALKVGEAMSSAVKSALLALNGCIVRSTDGFIADTAEDTMRHFGRLSQEGLAQMNPVILEIMRHKCS